MTELWVKFQDTNPVKISTVGCRDVYDLLKSCRAELVNQLGEYDLNQLFLSTDDSTDTALWPSLLLPDIPGYSQIDSQKPLFIGLLPTTISRSSSSSSVSSTKTPHPSRKRRWDQINEMLENNSRRRPSTQTTGFSYITWKSLNDTLKLGTYEQPIRTIQPQALDLLMDYLKAVASCSNPYILGNEAARLQCIAPILYCVGQLFNGDVKIEIEEDLSGGYVKAHGRFEFVLRRKDKYVCIVEAKKFDLEQGMAQDIVGCEVAADIGGLDCVYGIVTNFDKWIFLKSSNDLIECDQKSSVRNLQDTEGLREITGKIYAMLSTEEEMGV
jgi:hypothetical protein